MADDKYTSLKVNLSPAALHIQVQLQPVFSTVCLFMQTPRTLNHSPHSEGDSSTLSLYHSVFSSLFLSLPCPFLFHTDMFVLSLSLSLSLSVLSCLLKKQATGNAGVYGLCLSEKLTAGVLKTEAK